MPDKKSFLCVGGPLAGRRYEPQSKLGFRVPVRSERAADADPSSPDYQPNKPVSYEIAEYREETFHTPEGDISFWVPYRQTAGETITLLLETYEQHHRRRAI